MTESKCYATLASRLFSLLSCPVCGFAPAFQHPGAVQKKSRHQSGAETTIRALKKKRLGNTGSPSAKKSLPKWKRSGRKRRVTQALNVPSCSASRNPSVSFPGRPATATAPSAADFPATADPSHPVWPVCRPSILLCCCMLRWQELAQQARSSLAQTSWTRRVEIFDPILPVEPLSQRRRYFVVRCSRACTRQRVEG